MDNREFVIAAKCHKRVQQPRSRRRAPAQAQRVAGGDREESGPRPGRRAASAKILARRRCNRAASVPDNLCRSGRAIIARAARFAKDCSGSATRARTARFFAESTVLGLLKTRGASERLGRSVSQTSRIVAVTESYGSEGFLERNQNVEKIFGRRPSLYLCNSSPKTSHSAAAGASQLLIDRNSSVLINGRRRGASRSRPFWSFRSSPSRSAGVSESAAWLSERVGGTKGTNPRVFHPADPEPSLIEQLGGLT